MILFKDDWNKYPRAIVHLSTKNRSAVKLSLKLKKMGIENHAFFLALHNPLLAEVDPFDPNLSAEHMFMIGVECRENPWYYFREIARAPSKAGAGSVSVEFTRSNVCLWWCFLLHITVFLTQPRQTGKTFGVNTLVTWLKNFGCNNTQINLLTKDEKLRTDNIQNLKDIYDELPAYLNFKDRNDTNNTEEISIKKLGNTYKTHVPQPSEKLAYNTGRGMSTPIFLTDETPFQRNISISLPAALGAMGAAIDSAKENNAPYGIIHTTTAGKKDDKDGRYVYGIIQESAIWSEKLYDCKDSKELRRVVIANSRENKRLTSRVGSADDFDGSFQIYAVFDHRQLGKDDRWLYEQLKRTRATGDDANRDFFNLWTSGTNTSPLDTEVVEKIAHSTCGSEFDTIEAVGGYIVRWYVPENELDRLMNDRSVILGNDPSDLSGGDDLGLVFTDSKTGGVVGSAKINENNLITFCKWLVTLFIKYPKLVSIIERRSSGAYIIDYLLMFLPEQGIDPFRRLFNWVVNDPALHPEMYKYAEMNLRNRPSDVYDRCKKLFGFATSGGGKTSRTELYSFVLKNATSRFATKIYDIHLANQITGLVERNGRIDHAPDEHDDLVIAWLLTHWFLSTAKNLSFYGIDPSKVYSSAQVSQGGNVIKNHDDYIQALLRNRIDEIINLMREEDNPMILERYERELIGLESRIVVRDGESFSLDAVLNELASSKRKRNNGRRHNPGVIGIGTGEYKTIGGTVKIL